MGAKDHRTRAEDVGPARCAVLTVSDSRTRDTDESGRLALEILAKFGHVVAGHQIVPNKPRAIAAAVAAALKDADMAITIGGTGPSKRDVSIEAVRGLVEKELPGFGEMFRALSQKEIGTAALMSRALLGVTKAGRLVVAVPGSPGAVRLALETILMNEIKHILWEVRRYAQP